MLPACTLERWVRWSFVSCKTQVRKPDAAAYLGAAHTLGVQPAQCVFIDDREKNCRGAVAAGMRAIHFVDVAQLRQALVEFGVLA